MTYLSKESHLDEARGARNPLSDKLVMLSASRAQVFYHVTDIVCRNDIIFAQQIVRERLTVFVEACLYRTVSFSI